ncbi:protein kinase, ATP binding site-containing protein, partial [Tanacetum coccineum]
FQHLKIELQAINSATNEFDDSHCIGKGGFGKVYKGELIHSKGQSVVALKRLDRAFGQGDPEFWKEIIMLSLYRHDNIVSLLGFCDDCGEKILVYNYASKRSLDFYLNEKDLKWVQRLEICIGAARGLAYLHNPGKRQQRVLHRDIKSSNILLDENWNARIADFGLSKFGPANQQYTFLVSNGVGTMGYCDPLYAETGLLTKESDVYSFGVVLFEILCGRLCIRYNHDKRLTVLVRKCYEQKTIADIVYDNIKDEINPLSLKAFTSIAYQCLNRDQEQRPLMTEVVKGLESALKCQPLVRSQNEPPTSSLSRTLRASTKVCFEKVRNIMNSSLQSFKADQLFIDGLVTHIERDVFFKEAFSLLSRDESHRTMHSGGSGVKGSTSAFNSRPNDNKGNNTSFVPRPGDNKKRFNNSNARNPNLVCTNCNMTSHTIEKYFELIGYPANFKKKGVTSQNVVSSGSVSDKGSSKGAQNNVARKSTRSNFVFCFLSSSFFNKHRNISTYSAFVGWIIDYGAGQHITFTTEFLFNVIDVSHFNVTVAHPNGTIANVNQIGNCKISDKIVLYDVLVVPGYQVSFLSVHQLAKVNKMLGHPTDQVFDVLKDKIDLKGFQSSEPCEVCHKAKQTRDPFPLSDHKTSSLDDLVHLDVWGPYRVTSRDGF